MTEEHARLSASGSSRWMNCHGSIQLTEKLNLSATTSKYALEGTVAHTVAEKCLTEKKEPDYFVGFKFEGVEVTDEMAAYVQEYLDYVEELMTPGSKMYIEQVLKIDEYIPGGFGTVDCLIIDKDARIAHVVDLKYGKGVTVSPENNMQLQIYALGVMQARKANIDKYILHVVQPRRYLKDGWSISSHDLRAFGEEVRRVAEIVTGKNPTLTPGKVQCRWCPAAGSCPALLKQSEDVVLGGFENLDDTPGIEALTDEQKRRVLDYKDMVEAFIKAVYEDVHNRVSLGETFPGYKLVKGRSYRRWNPSSTDEITEILGPRAFQKKLIGLTEAKAYMTEDQIESLTIKPTPKLSLVPESDKRPAFESDDAAFEKIP